MTSHSSPSHSRRLRRAANASAATDNSAASNASNSLRAAAQPKQTSVAPTTTAAAVPSTTSTTSSVVAPPTTSSTPAQVQPSTTSITSVAPVVTTTSSSSTPSTTSATSTTRTTTSTTSGRVPATPVSQAFGPPISSSTTSTSSTASSTSTALASVNDSTSSSFPTGAIIGVAVGGLVVLVVLASVIGYYIRKKRRADEYEDSPFDKDDFRRSSVLLNDPPSSGGYEGDMSEYGGGGLNRANTFAAAGLGRGATLRQLPLAHYNQHQGPAPLVPSFSPGQVVPVDQIYRGAGGPPSPSFGPPSPSLAAGFGGPIHDQGSMLPGVELYGGYPMPIAQQQQLDMNLYPGQPQTSQQHPYSQPQPQRQPSYPPRAQQPQQTQRPFVNPIVDHPFNPSPPPPKPIELVLPPREEMNFYAVPGPNSNSPPRAAPRQQNQNQRTPPGYEEGDSRPLSLVHEGQEEDDEQDVYSQNHAYTSPPRQLQALPVRTGTPLNSNVQQSYFSSVSRAGASERGLMDNLGHPYAQSGQRPRSFEAVVYGGAGEPEEDGHRVLGVRNASREEEQDDEDDGYGGYA